VDLVHLLQLAGLAHEAVMDLVGLVSPEHLVIQVGLVQEADLVEVNEAVVLVHEAVVGLVAHQNTLPDEKVELALVTCLMAPLPSLPWVTRVAWAALVLPSLKRANLGRFVLG